MSAPFCFCGNTRTTGFKAYLRRNSQTTNTPASTNGNSTGDTTIRAGLPAGWLAGEKTGSCELGGRNDAGFVRSPAGKNHALAIYTLAPQLEPKERDALIAETARLVTAQLEPQK